MTPKLAWAGCGALALHDKVGVIANLPDGIYRRQVGEHWRIVFNGTDKPSKTEGTPELPPFAVYVEFNGWPAGIIDPSGGIIAAGDAANEDAFISAIEAELGCGIEESFARRTSETQGSKT